MVQDIRDAASAEQILKILNDRISGLARKRPVAPPIYAGTPVSPFDGAGPTTTLNASTDYRIATVSIPDPGYPYKIEVSGGVFMQGLSTTQTAGVSHTITARVDSTTPIGPSATPTAGAFAAAAVGQMGGASGAFTYAVLPRRPSPTVWTGAHTVDLFIKMGVAGTAVVPIPLASRSDFYFDVRVVPATT